MKLKVSKFNPHNSLNTVSHIVAEKWRQFSAGWRGRVRMELKGHIGWNIQLPIATLLVITVFVGCGKKQRGYYLVGILEGSFNTISDTTGIYMCDSRIGSISEMRINKRNVIIDMNIFSEITISRSAQLYYTSNSLLSEKGLVFEPCDSTGEIYKNGDTLKIHLSISQVH